MQEQGPIMWRSAVGIIVGGIAWMFVFTALAMALALVWPAYTDHGRTWFEQGLFTFTPLMALCNLLLWVLAALAAGTLAIRIARRPGPVWLMAVLMWGYAVAMHIVLYWPRFPWWYNLGVVIPLIPAVWLGSRWGRPRSTMAG